MDGPAELQVTGSETARIEASAELQLRNIV